MKRIHLIMFLALAVVAGMAGSVIQQLFEKPKVVRALVRSDKGMRVAVLRLEEAARESALFKSKKADWEKVQAQFIAENEQDVKDIRELQGQYRSDAQSDSVDQDDLAAIQLEIKSRQEMMKVKRDQQQKYLAVLLEQYQKTVLQAVMREVEKYVDKEGYDLVLQDYQLKGESQSEFLARDSYSQTLMSKPVLYAPKMLRNNNDYITDITDSIVQRVK